MSDRSRRYAAFICQDTASTDFPCSIYASIPFKFVVEGEPLYIHANLVSFHSKVLDRLVNGHMAEARNGFATLEDVDRDTFVRFIEWAYTGYYTAAEFTTLVEESSNAPGSCKEDKRVVERPYDMTESLSLVEDEDNGWGANGWGAYEIGSKKGKSKKKIFRSESPIRTTREDLMQSFKSRRPIERKTAIELPRPRQNRSSAEVYSDVFLSHARLYVFAEKYDIQTLKLLALDELHATLVAYTLYPRRTGDIVDLLRYVYANAEPTEGKEDMRTLMTQYVGWQVDILIDDEDFRDLMLRNGGPLFSDFLDMVGKRISKAM